MQTALVIIAMQGYQDVELQGTREALAEAGCVVVLGSTEAGICRGKFGGREQSAVALRDVHVSAYDRIAYIGGPGAGTLWKDAEAVRIAREAAEKGMPLGAVCIAPTVLAEAGVLKGKRATVWNPSSGSGQAPSGSPADFLRERGADYTGEAVTVDGMIVTGNGPDAARAFGEALGRL